MRVVVANEPRAYREVLAATIAALRPHVQVLTVDPAHLDEALRQSAPKFVLCSDVTPLIERIAYGWILLYPGGATESAISIGGRRQAVANIELDDILAALDEVARMSDAGNPTG